MMETVGESMTKEEFKAKVTDLYCSTSRGLTLKGFKEFWRDQIKEKTEATVWEWLRKLGYDRDFYGNQSRSFILTMHSDDPLTVQLGDAVHTNLEESAQQMILRKDGRI